MPAVTDSAPPATTAFGYPAVDASPLYEGATGWQVVTLAQEDRIRPTDQKLVPTIAVGFRVPPFPGIFTIRIDNYAFTHADVRGYMDERAYLIRALYAIPARLPPFVPLGGFATGVVLTLDSATAAKLADGSGAIAWAGTVWARGVTATVQLEVTRLGDFDPFVSSDPLPVAASDAVQPVSGTFGPLDPDKYSVQLSAQSSLGIGYSIQRAVTVP